MKRLFLPFIAGVTFQVASYAAPPFTHAETGISLPDTIAGFSRGKAKTYQLSPDESGVGIPYRNGEILAVISIRQNDPKKFGSPSAIVEDGLATVKELEKSYSNVKVFKSADESETSGWAKGSFTVNGNVTFIYATIKGGYGIKLRISPSNLKNESIEKFVGEFQRLIDKAKPE